MFWFISEILNSLLPKKESTMSQLIVHGKDCKTLTQKRALAIQWAINLMIEWTDDSEVYGKSEDWRVPTITAEYNPYLGRPLMRDDCDSFMSTAMAIARGKLDPDDKVKQIIKSKTGLDWDTLFISGNIDDEDIALTFVACEKPEVTGDVVDGTKSRGFHAIAMIRDGHENTSFIIDNRGILMTGKRVHTQKEADRVNSLPMAGWIEEGFAECYIIDQKYKFEENNPNGDYLLLSFNVLDGTGTWRGFENPKWQFILHTIMNSHEIARKEGLRWH